MPKNKNDRQINKDHKKRVQQVAAAQAFLNQPAPMAQLTIMMINAYKDYNYMIQQVGFLAFEKRMFQYIIFDRDTNQFYQTYVIITPSADGDAIRNGEVAKALALVNSMAETTIETLIRKKDPNFKGTPEEEAELEKGAILSNALDNAKKEGE